MATEEAAGGISALARRLGALQEARRLDSAVVGTEHLLVATLADPVVREAFGAIGCDLHDVQAVVESISGTRERALGDERVELTAEATAVLADVVGRDPGPAGRDTGATSATLRRTVVALLTGSDDTAARRIVAELRILDEVAGLVARLTPSSAPRRRD